MNKTYEANLENRTGTHQAHSCVYAKRMNPELAKDPEDDTKYLEGSGAIGGWEKSELRQYYKDILKSLVPENVQSGIKAILKSQNAYYYSRNSFYPNHRR